jgi:sugar phosphate permease
MQVKTESSRFVNGSPVFFGWVVAIAGTFGLIMTSPGQTYSVSIFTEQFISELGLSRSLVSTLYSVATLTGSFMLPFVGRQIDKRGSQKMVIIISILFGAACVYMGFIQNAIMLALGFVGIRLLGQGSLSLVSQNVINQWWVRRRGAISGFVGLAFSFIGLAAFPNLINWLISTFDWRIAYMALGGLVWLVMIPIGVFLFRDNPESFGLLPDGDQVENEQTADISSLVAETNWTLAEALRTRAFWVMMLGLASTGMLSTGLFFHMVSIFADNGMPAAIAAAAFVPIAITTALVNLGSGLLADKIGVRILLAVGLWTLAIALWLAQAMETPELAFAYGIILGFSNGATRVVSSIVWANYFGRQHLGAISGFATTIGVVGTALGPMPFGIVRDLTGSYASALLVSALIPLVLGIMALLTPAPQQSMG